ncbi:MAG TPA: hypothetical protein DCY88_03765 [Cyanobacteria bacterium UBA11372]|nr:hypothetical protein [Cyanobacteria bacterium UBA11372]
MLLAKSFQDLTPPQPLPETERGFPTPPSLAGKGVGGLGFPTLPTVSFIPWRVRYLALFPDSEEI